MTEPTDKELEAFAIEEEFLLFCDVDEFTQIARAVLAKWGTPAPVGVEPVFAFRRKGLDDFCTCTEKRYAELSLKPNLFETRIFYTEPPVLAMGRVPPNWPTNEMIEAGRKAAISHGPLLGGGQSLWHVFRDMFAAAPSPQKQGGQRD